jgi:hypothetical protein
MSRGKADSPTHIRFSPPEMKVAGTLAAPNLYEIEGSEINDHPVKKVVAHLHKARRWASSIHEL